MDQKSFIRKLSRSPAHFSNRAERYLERKRSEGLENTADFEPMLKFMRQEEVHRLEKETDPAWHENNLESDLRATDWILQKVRASEAYAQNLYAALCNNDFQKIDVVTILKNETWHCSWRYAGGIVADMRESGDYLDWYCSGIRDTSIDHELDLMSDSMSEQELVRYEKIYSHYVGESVVTDEIRADLKRLGWQVIEQPGD